MAGDYIKANKREEKNNLLKQYPDIVPTHPNLSDEELEKMLEKELEKCKEMKEWPLV